MDNILNNSISSANSVRANQQHFLQNRPHFYIQHVEANAKATSKKVLDTAKPVSNGDKKRRKARVLTLTDMSADAPAVTPDNYARNRTYEDLGNGTKVDPETGEVVSSEYDYYDDHRARYTLQDAATRILNRKDKDGNWAGHRIAFCEKGLGKMEGGKSPKEFVKINKRANGDASFQGLAHCDDYKVCPVCAAKISAGRAKELRHLFDWARSNDYFVNMITLTTRHKMADDCATLVNNMSKALSSITGHYSYKQMMKSLGMVGWVRSFEVTYTLENGWHPHYHIVFITKKPFKSYVRTAFSNLWRGWFRKHGFEVPTDKHGVNLQDASKMQTYIEKFGELFKQQNKKAFTEAIALAQSIENSKSKLAVKTGTEQKWDLADEMSKGHKKRGTSMTSRTPFEILADAAAGCKVSANLFLEYAKAFHGKKCFYWMPADKRRQQPLSLKQLCELEDKTDSEMVEQWEGDAKNFAVIPRSVWLVLHKIGRANVRKIAGTSKDLTQFVRTTHEHLEHFPEFRKIYKGSTPDQRYHQYLSEITQITVYSQELTVNHRLDLKHYE